MSKIPEWAFSKALEACNISHGAGKFGVESIALALVAAERRGIERAAKVADKREAMAGKVSHPAAVALLQSLPLAIRQLGETDK